MVRLFDPPFLPDFGLVQGGLLNRADMPVLFNRILVTKAGNLVSGDGIKQTTRLITERILEKQ